MDAFFDAYPYALPVVCIAIVWLFVIAAWYRAFWLVVCVGVVSAAVATFAATASVSDVYGLGVETWQAIAGLCVVAGGFCWVVGMYIRATIAADNDNNQDSDLTY